MFRIFSASGSVEISNKIGRKMGALKCGKLSGTDMICNDDCEKIGTKNFILLNPLLSRDSPIHISLL